MITSLKRLFSFMPLAIKYYLLQLYLSQKYKAKIGKGVALSLQTMFEGDACVYEYCDISGSLIGRGTFIAKNSSLPHTKIGRFCSIGQNVHAFLGRHPTQGFVSTHPAFYSIQEQAGFTFVKSNHFKEHLFLGPENKYVVEIGNDVWIGNNVIIMDGIRVGDGAIIAAGAVVTKDVEPYSIVGGVPAKLIRYRFEKKQIEYLLKYKWWAKSYGWISENATYFSDIKSFQDRFGVGYEHNE